MPEIRPQRVNAGGNLAPNEVVGRDRFIADQWRTLERQSILLTAERRMGKTSVVKKMRAEPPAGVTPIYRSFEAVRTRQEFVEAVLTDFRDHLPIVARAKDKLVRLAAEWQFEFETGPLRISVPRPSDWKPLLQRVFEAVCDRESGQLALFWDEIPVMLGAVAQTEGEAAAQELLDVLRVVRQTHESVRMVFTGSLGLHHVVADIRPDGYSSAPVNDMLAVELPGLEPDDAVVLGRSLLLGERLTTADDEAVAAAMAEATSGIPFYIQHVVAGLRDRRTIRTEDVAGVVDAALLNPVDPWEFRHYRDRIKAYYGAQESIALTILDAISVSDQPLPFGALHNRVKSQFDVAEDAVRPVLRLLQLDHYVRRSGAGYGFAFDIVARSWRTQRDLA